ncbi:MAG: LemA family protein [Gammaproteobacteria bacterium]|nr:LemA family protein [Gammaproteobacteria bacterium]MCP5417129.1 LemA family protein [Chromatiaceae bacterium]
MEIVLIVLGMLVAVLIYAMVIYNSLVTLKHGISRAWANIDVLLKQRHDELPKLVETCKRYMRFEQETLERVMRARAAVASAGAKGDIGALGNAENQLRLGLGNLFAVAEAYPELKANETFRHLRERITELEESIAHRREFYNESVNLNNVRIDQFPDLILARLFGFRPGALLEFSASEISDPNLKQLFE